MKTVSGIAMIPLIKQQHFHFLSGVSHVAIPAFE